MSDKQIEVSDRELFIVVCTELHAALGPFADPATALKVAQQLTERDKGAPDACVFVPVPFSTKTAALSRDELEEDDPMTPSLKEYYEKKRQYQYL